MKDNDMLILELTDEDMDQVVGGSSEYSGSYGKYGIKPNGEGGYTFHGVTISDQVADWVVMYARDMKKKPSDMTHVGIDTIIAHYQSVAPTVGPGLSTCKTVPSGPQTVKVLN